MLPKTTVWGLSTPKGSPHLGALLATQWSHWCMPAVFSWAAQECHDSSKQRMHITHSKPL